MTVGGLPQRDRATFLFCTPSWVDGLAGVINISGRTHVRYTTSGSALEADARAQRQDWLAVGDSLRGAMRQLDAEITRR